MLSNEFQSVDLKLLQCDACRMHWCSMLLEDESTGKQLIAVCQEFGKNTDIMCSVNFNVPVNKMQSHLALF